MAEIDTIAMGSLNEVIAEISICGAVKINVTRSMDFTKPTEEQIKNLKETFCIDVKLLK